jgi:tetratricopeptide (TPR) repeat protein
VKFAKYQALYPIVLMAAGFLIYANTFQSPFVFDDESMILHNHAIRMEEVSWSGALAAISGKGRNRPVSTFSFALNYYFDRYNPRGYHLVNLAIHVAAGVLLYFFLILTLRICNRQNSGKPALDRFDIITISGLAALLWLVNPVQTQSVTYIVQRTNSMAGMFFMLALVLYVKGRLAHRQAKLPAGNQDNKQYQGQPRRHCYFWYLGCAVAGMLAFGSKENTASLPFFIILFEWYFFQDLSKKRLTQLLAAATAILLLVGLIAFMHLGLEPWEKLQSLRDFSEDRFTIGERLLTQTRVVMYYLSLIFYPNPSRLNLDYDFPLSVSLLDPATTLPALIGLMGLAALGIFLARKQRLISFCIFWFLGNLVIESSVIPLAIIFEHRLYLPSMLVWLVPVILARRHFRSQGLIIGFACVPLVLFAFWTLERNNVWRDAVSLWADCAKKSPNKARIYNNLGTALFRQNKIVEARQNIRKALALEPEMADAHYNLGRLLEEENQIGAAIERYRRAIELAPASVSALNNLGVALLKRDDIDASIELFNRALQIEPWFAQTHSNLGLAKFKQGKIDAAIAQYTKALQLDPVLAEVHFNLGVALRQRGDTESGIHHIRKALEIDPDYAAAHNNLGGHLLSQGKTDQAVEHLTRAISIDPDLAEAHNNLGIILIRQGDLEAAISHFRQAVRLDPDFKLARNNLQKALALPGGMDSEIASVRRELDTRPDDPELRFKMGNLYLAKGQLGEAVAEFELALSLRPDYLEAQNNLAMAYAAGRQYDQALAAFKKLMELDPGNSGNYYNVAVLYALQNNVPQSIAWLKKAIHRGYRNWDLIKTDKDLANIRSSGEYKNLVKGH